jgi:hypothetical protein
VAIDFSLREFETARQQSIVCVSHGGAATYREWLEAMATDATTRLSFAATLANVPYPAFAWECRPVTTSTLDLAIEMVAIESPVLARSEPDATPFEDALAHARDDVVVFANLGRDAQLVVPRQLAAPDAYTHIASFVRRAPAPQIDQLFRVVADSIVRVVGSRAEPLWVSTAGLGVSWLHVRLDDRPKYYRHEPFRCAPSR